jgi:hypothetical protein
MMHEEIGSWKYEIVLGIQIQKPISLKSEERGKTSGKNLPPKKDSVE